MSFYMPRRKGGGVGRVLAFATMANQPHALHNKFIPGSGVGARSISIQRFLSRRATIPAPEPTVSISYIYSKNNITDGGFTIGNSVTKDMNNAEYTNEMTPNDYPQFFPDMAPLIEDNIVVGDKGENHLTASYWDDLGDDIFDSWGYFYLYDVNTGKYYFPIINPQNDEDGIFSTQTFNAFGRTFTIKHGWAVQGIFKFDISVNDSLPFKFGAYGNMGSDGDQDIENLTQNYSIGGQNLTLYYHRDQATENDYEILYSYWIPKKVTENSSQTYNNFYDSDNMSMLSTTVTNGLIVYFAKINDVKDWVINDLGII